MAKKTLPQSTYATNNIQNQPDQVKGQATALKLSFDQTGIDSKTYNNTTLLPALADETLGNSGSNAIGHNSASVTANNVGDALEENRQIIDNLSTADGQNVKLTGNQTVAGTKTFSSSPIVPIPSSGTQAVNKQYVDDLAPLNISDGSLKDIKLSDEPGNIKSNVYNSQLYDAARFAVSQKGLWDGQSDADATVGAGFIFGVDTADKAVGKQSYKITTSNGSGSARFENLTPIDFSKLLGGEDFTASDFLGMLTKVIDSSVITNIGIELCSDAVFSGDYSRYIFTDFTDNKWEVASVVNTPLVIGTGADLSNIQSFRIFVTATGVTNVNFNYIQSIKKHPTLAQPEYFQEKVNGIDTAIFTVDTGNYFVGKEFGKYIIRDIKGSDASSFSSLRTNIQWESGIARLIKRTQSVATLRSITYWVESDYDNPNFENNVRLSIESDNLRLAVRENNIQVLYTVPLPIEPGDTVELVLKKKGSSLTARGRVNFGEWSESITAETTLIGGILTFGAHNNENDDMLFAGFSAIDYVDSAGVSETAKRLEEQAYCEYTRPSTQSIPETVTKVLFTNKVKDNRNEFDVDTSTWTCRESGYRTVSAFGAFTADNNGFRYLSAYIDNVEFEPDVRNAAGLNFTCTPRVSFKKWFDAGDTIDFRAYQVSTGSPLNLLAGSRFVISK